MGRGEVDKGPGEEKDIFFLGEGEIIIYSEIS